MVFAAALLLALHNPARSWLYLHRCKIHPADLTRTFKSTRADVVAVGCLETWSVSTSAAQSSSCRPADHLQASASQQDL